MEIMSRSSKLSGCCRAELSGLIQQQTDGSSPNTETKSSTEYTHHNTNRMWPPVAPSTDVNQLQHDLLHPRSELYIENCWSTERLCEYLSVEDQ